MYCYSIESRNKVVHNHMCYHVKRITKDNLVYTYDADSARKNGYKMCKCCAPIIKYIKGNEREIQSFCLDYGLTYYLHDGYMIITTVYSKWKIVTAGKDKKIFLYHRNAFDDGADSKFFGYHSQAVREESIIGYLKYIVEHDKYRRKNPIIVFTKKEPPKKGTKRWRKEMNKKKYRDKKRAVAKVLNLIEQIV